MMPLTCLISVTLSFGGAPLQSRQTVVGVLQSETSTHYYVDFSHGIEYLKYNTIKAPTMFKNVKVLKERCKLGGSYGGQDNVQEF